MKNLLVFTFLVFTCSGVLIAAERLTLDLGGLPYAESSFVPIGQPIFAIEEGHYVSEQGLLKSLQISEWADESIATALIPYGNGHVQARFNVRHIKENVFGGNGRLRVDYSSGKSCFYPGKILIKAYDNGLYIKSEIPSAIPSQIVNGVCTRFESVTVSDKSPYVLE